MNEEFKGHVEALEPAYRRLVGMEPVTVPSLPKDVPAAGVYLFSEQGAPLYVGRTNRMRPRLQEHCRPSSPHGSAPFAFKLAREATGRTEASYVSSGSRAQLEQDPEFKVAFERAKQRIGGMEVRFVEEADPLRQGLLEIYVAFTSGAKYNDFDTH
jgi:hypothetical protein